MLEFDSEDRDKPQDEFVDTIFGDKAHSILRVHTECKYVVFNDSISFMPEMHISVIEIMPHYHTGDYQ